MKPNNRLPGRSATEFSSPRLSQRRAADIRSTWSSQEKDIRARLAKEMQRRLFAATTFQEQVA